MIHKLLRQVKKVLFKRSTRTTHEILETFKEEIVKAFGEHIIGIYAIGSLAMDDFNEALSDIDFVVIMERPLEKKALAKLRNIHLSIEKSALQPNLNGIYILEEDLEKKPDKVRNLTFFHEGSMQTYTDGKKLYEINPITWMELKTFAMTIYGKDSRDLKIHIDWDDVMKYMHHNINTYWKHWLDYIKKPWHYYYYATLFRRSENAWCVSGVARQLYTLEKQEITSKRKACEYFKNKFPSKFEAILSDVICFRNGQHSSPPWKQKRETVKFLAFGIDRFNQMYQQKLDTKEHT